MQCSTVWNGFQRAFEAGLRDFLGTRSGNADFAANGVIRLNFSEHAVPSTRMCVEPVLRADQIRIAVEPTLEPSGKPK